jgi:hypothetical protein
MTIKIKIFSSFCDSEHCKLKLEDLCEKINIPNYGGDKDIYITTLDDYTHAIILNTAMPKLKNIPKKNVVGLAFEPPLFLNLTLEFIQYAEKYIGKYFIGDKYDLPRPFVEHYAYTWHTKPLTYIPIKNKTLSIMVSEKNMAPGHKYRHLLVQRILSMNLPVDIYGRGCEIYNNYKNTASQLPNNDFSYESLLNIHKRDPRLKGCFQNIELYENYDFHICIENFKTAEYFSEKVIDPLLCGTTPIYWGCKNIDNYFPGYTIQLSGNIETDILLISDILRDPLKYKKTIDVDFVKDKINLLKNLDTVFS